jgi:hypothetical protein
LGIRVNPEQIRSYATQSFVTYGALPALGLRGNEPIFLRE